LKTIFRYELRRLIFNEFFIGLLLINGVYSWYILTTDIIAGIGYTAPFSPWSFGAYLGKIMPIMLLSVFFLLTFYYSKKEKQTAVLTNATAINPKKYLLIRNIAILVCFLIVFAVVILLSVLFYVRFFGFYNFADFLIPGLIIPLPCFIFTLGLGHLAGRIHKILLYILMIAVMCIGFLNFDNSFDFFGNNYFGIYPKTLTVNSFGEPDFSPQFSFFIARFFYFSVGILLLVFNTFLLKRKGKRA
jgi:ABC-2 type transport system permease protein